MIIANEKILIVDDTAANVHLLANVLEPRGYEILAASNAEQGLKVAARTQPDMIASRRRCCPAWTGSQSAGRSRRTRRRRRFLCCS